MKSIVILVHYFPPLNSAGARRIEGLAKYFVQYGNRVVILTTIKKYCYQATESTTSNNFQVFEIDCFGLVSNKEMPAIDRAVDNTSGSDSVGFLRFTKNRIMEIFGQIPDPRLFFALAMLSPFLDKLVKKEIMNADFVIGSTPPWPMLLAGTICRWRFGKKVVLDYRDNFSRNHAMQGSAVAKIVEVIIDKYLASRANMIVTVSEPISKYYNDWNPRTFTVRNGYDSELFKEIKLKHQWKRGDTALPKVVRFLGCVSEFSIPKNLLLALSSLYRIGYIKESDVRFEYFGNSKILENYLEKRHDDIKHFFSHYPTVEYVESLRLMVVSDFLLFSEVSGLDDLSAKGVLTTKLSEYLASGRPIIADINPKSLAGSTIKKGSKKHFVSQNAFEFEKFFASDKFTAPTTHVLNLNIQEFSRATLAKSYLNLLVNDR